MLKQPIRSVPAGLVSAGSDETAYVAAKRIAESCCGGVVVLEDDHMLGIFTERDLVVRVVAAGLDPAQTRLGDVMTTPVSEPAADEALRRMDEAFTGVPAG